MFFKLCDKINQLSKQQNTEKVAFVVIILDGELFKFKNWHQQFVLKSNFKCKTPNLIYVIICSGCNNEYIGQTGEQIKRDLVFTDSTFDNLNMKK